MLTIFCNDMYTYVTFILVSDKIEFGFIEDLESPCHNELLGRRDIGTFRLRHGFGIRMRNV